MPKKWSGDEAFHLPAKQVEPYRLWFEFLKLAHVDPEIDVDYEHYKEWGPIWEMPFNEWWGSGRWRELFAADLGVRVVQHGEIVETDANAIVVRIPLKKEPRETLKDVSQLLEEHGAGAALAISASGKFALSEGYEKAFLKYLDRANMMLRLYRIWLDHAEVDKRGRISGTALDFYGWAKGRDDWIRERGYRYTRPMFPAAVRFYAEEIMAGKDTSQSRNRRQFMRYLQKARNLATNAASGVFPGKY